MTKDPFGKRGEKFLTPRLFSKLYPLIFLLIIIIGAYGVLSLLGVLQFSVRILTRWL